MNSHSDEMRLELVKSVAGRGVDTDGVSAIARQLNYGADIRGVNPCVYGICIDFVVAFDEIHDLLSAGPFGPVRIFPWGVSHPSLFHVQIERQFKEIPAVV